MASLADSNFEDLANHFNYPSLKPFQKAVLRGIIEENKDTFVCAKTGSGKSLCFQGLVYLFRELGLKRNPIVLVISPLISLMESQVEDLKNKGISATYIGKDSSENSGIRNGQYSYVYSNPENLTSGMWREMLLTKTYRENLACIVFDEVHTAVSWGLDKKDEDAFRPEFARVGELRSMVPRCPMLAMTATASPSVRVKIQRLLAMKNPLEVVESPDRENIKITVTKVKVEISACFKWLADLLNNKGKECEKVIVYCRRIQDCSKLFLYFKDEVEDKQLFNMFHSRTNDKVKTQILSTIKDPKSNLRVIIATNAVGMGLDFNCNCVINYGPPSEYDAYLQQIGRVGRDGTSSKAMLVYHPQQLRKLSPEMLSVLKSETCRRIALRNLYGDKTMKTVTGCQCCDICEQNCECGSCEENIIPFCLDVDQGDEVEFSGMERFVSDEDGHRLEVHLLSLKNELDRETSRYSSIASHGLSNETIKLLVNKAAYIFDIDTILDKFGIFHQDVAIKILHVYSAVFGDTDMDFEFEEDSVPNIEW